MSQDASVLPPQASAFLHSEDHNAATPAATNGTPAPAPVLPMLDTAADLPRTSSTAASTGAPPTYPSTTAAYTSDYIPPLFVAADHAHDNRQHLLFCSSGSVATIKAAPILRALSAHHSRLSIRVILTAPAAQFLAGQSAEQPHWRELLELPGVEAVYRDADEWIRPWTRGEPILHIELRRWADLCVVAPLSANSLAKFVGGWADNLLLSVLRAWDATGLVEGVVEAKGGAEEEGAMERRKKVVVVAPAMNTAMWLHPVTAKQVRVLEQEWGVEGKGEDAGWVQVLRPKTGELACGDVGIGAMISWEEIVKCVEERLGLNRDREA